MIEMGLVEWAAWRDPSPFPMLVRETHTTFVRDRVGYIRVAEAVYVLGSPTGEARVLQYCNFYQLHSLSPISP